MPDPTSGDAPVPTLDNQLAYAGFIVPPGVCPLNPLGQHQWTPQVRVSNGSVIRCMACGREEWFSDDR